MVLTPSVLICAEAATNVDTTRVEGSRKLGGGYEDPLMEDTDRAGVDIQLEPVMNVPLTWLEPVSVLKLPESPKT